MRLKLDESVTHQLQQTFRGLGHDVSTAADEDLLGKTDPEIAAAAAGEKRMLFALDFGFADIRAYPPGAHAGIVVFRPSSPSLPAIIRCVMDFARQSDLNAL